MKKFLFILLLFVANSLLAQEPEVGIKILTKDESTGKSLVGATIEIYQDGKKVKTVATDSKGKIPTVFMPIGHLYVVKFKKSGYVTKVAQVDAHFDTPEDLAAFTDIELKGFLFEKVDGIDFSFMENDPIIKWEFAAEGYMTYDEGDLKEKLKRIDDLKSQMAKKLEELAKIEEEKKKQEADFQAYVDAGDKAMSKVTYQTAIEQYELALKIKDDTGAKTKLAAAKKKLAEEESSAQKEKDYIAKLGEAKSAFEAKNYEQAIKLYQDATLIKPEEQLPKDEVLKIQKLINEQKAKELEFNELVKQGNLSVTSKSYANAISKYEEALAIKQDPAVQTKLDEAKKLKEDELNAADDAKKKEEEYLALINSANALYDSKEWENSTSKYQEALLIKSNEAHPKDRIEEIKTILKDLEAANKVQKDYNDAIKVADDLFAQEKYKESKTAYLKASSFKPDEGKPKTQIQKIEDLLKQQAEREEDFNKLVQNGEVAVASELYDDAILKFEAALKIKEDDAVQTKIDNAKKLRADKIAADNEDKENAENYSKAIVAADKLFDSSSWQDAMTKYNEALSIKPGETHPTNRISVIIKKIADEQAKKDAAQKLENDYNKLSSDADILFDSGDFEKAKVKYLAALKIKVAEQYPTNRIVEINSELAKLEAERKLNEDYQAALNKATELYSQKKYTEALSKYNLASGIKSSEQEPKTKILEINQLITDQKNADQLEEDYQNHMKEGAALLVNNDYSSALSSYKKALGVKPGDSAAQAKIDETNKSILDKQNAEQKEKDFAGFVAKGETAFNAKNYQESKVNYNKALDIKIDTQVQTKIKEIDKLIAEEKLAAKQKALFDNTIKEADDLFTENDYQSALLKYQKANSIKDSQHANDRILDINKKLLDLKEKQELEQKFNDLVTKGNTYKTDKKNQLALDTYKEALAVKPDPAISEYIRELNTLIEEENQNKSKDQAYSDKISLADTKFGESDWEQAKGYYEQAKLLKPEETYPGERIAICNDKINEAAILKTDNEYQKIIDKADNYFNNNSYDEAISYYQSALDKRPNDPYPQEKIDAIKKINNDLVNSKNNAVKLEKEYNDLVKSADVLYNAENYEKALIKYKEAYSKKPTDNYVSQRITDIEGKLKNKVVQRNSNSEYDKLIIEADALMNPGTWANALSKYKKAQIFKPNEGYPKGQIILCKNMMGKENTGQEEKEYQEILAAAQKNLDEENFDKAKELYKKAKGMRPSDPIPQRKIDEINQILKNRKSSGTYDALISKADNLLEKKEWKDARKYYVQAYNLKNEAYPDKQIKKIDAANTEMFEKEYNKMITKADEYMGKQNYEKSKGLYLRAIKLLPNFDNSYPNQKLQEINNILNPPLATNNGLRNLGDPTVGVSDQDMQAKLDDAEKQRKYSIIQKVVNSNTELVSHKQNWSDKELEAAEKTKTIIVAIEEDVIQQSWEAEVQRVEATIAVEEQTEEYNEVQNEIAIYVEHGIFKQKELVENARLERTENNLNADVSRLKYEEEVVRIQTNVENQSELNVNAQTNEIYDNKEYVNFISDSHVTNDPNLDVARKNTEVKVVDMGVRIVNAQSQDAWNQEDITYETKNNVNLMVDEQIASRINSDIPREDMEDKVVDVTEGKSAYQDNLGRNQFDVVYDIKSYTDNAQEEISIATMSSDVPRQKMENEKVRIEEEMASESYAYTTNQSSANNNSKDYLDDEQKIQSEVFNEKDDERADDAENVIEIQDDIAQIQSNLVDDNQDVSFKTKDYADNQQVINTNAHINGDNKTKKNQDRSSEMVEDLNNSKVIDAENNEKKVNKTEDYILKLKDIDLDKIDVYVKNKLGEEYPNGVTEEIYEQYDNQGLLISFVTRRLVVVEGEGNIYERTKARYGVSYTKNGEGITEMLWDDETNNAYLVRN